MIDEYQYNEDIDFICNDVCEGFSNCTILALTLIENQEQALQGNINLAMIPKLVRKVQDE